MTEQESKIEGKFNVIAILVHQQIALIQKIEALQASNEAVEARLTAIERRNAEKSKSIFCRLFGR